jgi:hypothetical protein
MLGYQPNLPPLKAAVLGAADGMKPSLHSISYKLKNREFLPITLFTHYSSMIFPKQVNCLVLIG